MDADDVECCGEELACLRKAKEGAINTIYQSVITKRSKEYDYSLTSEA